MNYFADALYDNFYTLDWGEGLTPNNNILCTDGSVISYARNPSYGSNFLFHINNYFKRAEEQGKKVLAIVDGSSTSINVYVPSAYDYVIVTPYQDELSQLQAHNLTLGNGGSWGSSTFSDDYLGIGLSYVSQFINMSDDYTYTQYYSDLEYGRAVYDFTSLYEDTTYYTSDGYGFHSHFLKINAGSSIQHLHLGVGNPFASIRDNAYADGYNNGYIQGNNDGYNNGYNDGINSVPDRQTLTAFDYLTTAYNAVGGIFSIEVLPHITLGLCASIPLVLVLCITIFKVLKK